MKNQIHSAPGITCCNCRSRTVRRMLQQKSAIGTTCVSVKSLRLDAITNDAKSRHSPMRSRKNPKYKRVVPCPHSNRASLHTMHCRTCSSRVQSNCFRLLGSTGIDVRKLWQNMASTQHWECRKLPSTCWLAINQDIMLASFVNVAYLRVPHSSV